MGSTFSWCVVIVAPEVALNKRYDEKVDTYSKSTSSYAGRGRPLLVGSHGHRV